MTQSTRKWPPEVWRPFCSGCSHQLLFYLSPTDNNVYFGLALSLAVINLEATNNRLILFFVDSKVPFFGSDEVGQALDFLPLRRTEFL
jgi:hypothetical protein